MTARIIDPHRPLWGQLVPGVPVYTNGKQCVQSWVKPGMDYWRIWINVKEVA